MIKLILHKFFRGHMSKNIFDYNDMHKADRGILILLSFWFFFLSDFNFVITFERKKKKSQSYDKSPYTDRKIQKAMWEHKKKTP